jgi:hypothetical protein
MNQALTKEQLAALEVAAPTMTRSEKLERWATLIEAYPHLVALFDRLEHMRPIDRERAQVTGSAFSLAARDPVLKDAGLAGGTVGDVKKFFELSDDELHAFSCNCGGGIDNFEMARRIRLLKERTQGFNPRGVVAGLVATFALSSIAALGTIGLLHL